MRDLFHLPDQNPLTVGGLAKFCNASVDGAINISCVWNNPQINFNGLYMRVNNINSGSASNLFDIGISNSSLCKVDKIGKLQLGNTTGNSTINVYHNGTGGYIETTGGPLSIGAWNGVIDLTSNIIGMAAGNKITLSENASIEWGQYTNNHAFGHDVGLFRGGSGVLCLRYGTAPQQFRVYNTYNGTNDEWGYLKWDSNVLKLGATKSGTGMLRNLMLESTNRSAYIATPTVEQIRDILISFGLMEAS